MSRSEKTSAAVRLFVNGREREVPGSLTLAGLLKELELDPRQVAVERNEKLVRRDAFEGTRLEEGDRIEIVTFFGGG